MKRSFIIKRLEKYGKKEKRKPFGLRFWFLHLINCPTNFSLSFLLSNREAKGGNKLKFVGHFLQNCLIFWWLLCVDKTIS